MTKTAVITGGTGGMGMATARILGTDHRIVLADLNQERIDAAIVELSASGIDAYGTVCDITDRASVEKLMVFAEAGDHHVRAVVHTAGVSPQMGSAQFVAHINAIGTVNVTEAFLARAAEGDALVNVASVAGHGLPKVLVPSGAFPKAASDPVAFEKIIVRRSRVFGKKLHSGLAYSFSKAFVIWYSRKQAAAFVPGERASSPFHPAASIPRWASSRQITALQTCSRSRPSNDSANRKKLLPFSPFARARHRVT